MLLPGDASGEQFFVWGHPVSVRGDVTKGAVDATLRAENIPAGAVRRDARRLPARPPHVDRGRAGALGRRARSGSSPRRSPTRASSRRTSARSTTRKDHLGRTLLILLGIADAARARRDRRDVVVLRARAPHELRPRVRAGAAERPRAGARSARLLRQSTNVGATEFTATLFDLIRRGRYKSTPVTTEKSIWGGLRKENVADLELSPGEELDLKPFERAVEEVADSVMGSGSQLLSNFRDEIAADRETNSKRFERFKARVDDAVMRSEVAHARRPAAADRRARPLRGHRRDHVRRRRRRATARSRRRGPTSS